MTTDSLPYPVRFSVDYPERLSRLTTAFRVFMVIPIFVVLFTVEYYALGEHAVTTVFASGGLLFFPRCS